MFTLEGRTALVSGPTGSIGSTVVRNLLEDGMNVVLMSDKLEKSKAVAKTLSEYGDRVYASRAGMQETEFCRANLQSIYDRFGSIDVLVLINGTEPSPDGVEEVKLDDWKTCLNTHLNSPLMFVKACLPYLKKSRAPRIILTAGMEAQSGGVEAGIAYSVAKGGVISFMKTLASMLAPHGICVNCVAPGGIYNLNQITLDQNSSDISRVDASKKGWSTPRNDSPLGRSCTAKDVAAAYEFLASEEAGFITGQVLNVNGGMYI